MKLRRKLVGLFGAVLAPTMAFIPLTACNKTEVTLTSIAITEFPSSTYFYVGEELKLDGMVVSGIMSDGTTKTITDYTVEPALGTKLTAENKEVTIKYSNKVTKFKIYVSDIIVQPVSSEAELVGDCKSDTFNFAISREMQDDQTIEVAANSQNFDISFSKKISSNIIGVKIGRKDTTSHVDVSETINITFTGKKGDEVLWTAVLKDYAVKYIVGAYIDVAKRNATTEFDSVTSTASHTFEIELNKVYDNADYEVQMVRTDGTEFKTESSFVVEKVGTEGKGKIKETVVFKNEGLITEGQSCVDFNLVIFCIDKETHKALIPLTTLTGFKLTYVAGTNAIAEDAFSWGGTVEAPILTGVDFEQATGKNALKLPAKHNGKSYTIADGVFYNSAENAGTKIPEAIKILAFEDITAIDYPANCFKDAPFTVLNLLQGEPSRVIDDVTFGDSSFAFATAGAGANKGGKILSNDSFTTTQKNTLQGKLWAAGLNSPGWYDYIEVSNERELNEAIWNGGNIWLSDDITLTSPLVVNDINALIDFYGHTITADKTFSSYDSGTKQRAMVEVYNANLVLFDSLNGAGEADFGGIKAHYATAGTAKQGDFVFTATGNNKTCSVTIYNGLYEGNYEVLHNTNANVFVKSIEVDGTPYDPMFKLYKDSMPSTIVAYQMFRCENKTQYHETGNPNGKSTFEFTGGKFLQGQKNLDPSATWDLGKKYTYYPSESHIDQKDPEGSPSSGNYCCWTPTGYKCTINNEIGSEQYTFVVKE